MQVRITKHTKKKIIINSRIIIGRHKTISIIKRMKYILKKIQPKQIKLKIIIYLDK